MPNGVVLSLYDRSGVMVEPWRDAGYECWCVDVTNEHGCRNGIVFVQADMRTWTLPETKQYRVAFAFPPCTHLASSGARWWKGKGLKALAESIELVGCAVELLEAAGCPWMIENPIGSLSTHWKEPDARFDPCDYAGYLEDPDEDAYTKRTNLWVGNGFNVPIPKWVFPTQGSKMHVLPPSADRAAIRSQTPRGFARAVYEANKR